jgi:hypothetical protein
MKKTIIIFLAIVVVYVTGVFTLNATRGSTTTAGQTTEIGRFVLSTANYVVVNGGAAENELDIFKIDTVTGKTWHLTAVLSDEKYTEQWVIIPE